MRRQHEYELENFGTVLTERVKYTPLDEVHVTFICAGEVLDQVYVEVCDGAGRVYFREAVAVENGEARVTVTAGGAPGLHVIRLFKEDVTGFWSFRMGSFVLEAYTDMSAEGTDLHEFVAWLRTGLEACIDWALYGGKWVAGDKVADNSPMNLAYPRFRLDAGVYLESSETLKAQLDLSYAHQNPDGSLYDHIYGDSHPGWEGEHKIRSLMADLETGLIINVWQVWMATADTDWMAGLIEPMRRGWQYATGSPDLWCEELGLIKKPHSADEWDVQMGDGSCFRNENSLYVASLCDAVRMPKAADCLADMFDAVGRCEEAGGLREFATSARRRANELLWDGVKYRHHEHIDPVDHGEFDESRQLVMSNAWACNHGLADHEQAVAIIEEYQRRLHETGDAFPWWSLQPGYPEGHFPRYPPGMYLNGGLFPWVGGQLCRACFFHGFEQRGRRLLDEFWRAVKAEGGACPTWFTLDGRAAANTHWSTRYDTWGIASWGQAAIEGLAGVVALSPGMDRAELTLRWAAAGLAHGQACIALPASRSYFAYEYRRSADGLSLTFTGSGSEALIRIPGDVPGRPSGAVLNGSPVQLEAETVNGVPCWRLAAPVAGVNRLAITV